MQGNIKSGLGSGEGVIWNVRDPIEKKDPIKDKGRVVGYEDVIADHGVDDKRLMVLEQEFAHILKVMGREGNTLSPILRQAWDSGDLRVMTKNSPAKATGAHISILGHVTKEELLRFLTATEAANGFLNRFLVACVRRSQYLPDGGVVPEQTLSELARALASALCVGQGMRELQRDPTTRDQWWAVYPILSRERPGLLGAATSRAEAQVTRLQALYAVLDQSPVIRQEHLEAALALWAYCEQSAAYVFGERLGDPVADTLLDALRKAGNEGLSRTEIRDLFHKNRSAEDIASVLATLADLGLATMTPESSKHGRGRKIERWWSTTKTTESGPSGVLSYMSFMSSPPPESAIPSTRDEETGRAVPQHEELEL